MDELIDIFQKFESAGVRYCVLRNFGFVEGDNIDGDIDILVSSEDSVIIDEILREKEYFPFEGDTTHQTRYKGYVSSIGQIVTIDLYWDHITYNGLPFLDRERVLQNRRRYNDIWIPSKTDYFLELVFHPVLNKNRYREKYLCELDRLRDQVDPESARSYAKECFGATGKDAVDFALAGDYDIIIDQKWELVRQGVKKQPRSLFTLVWNLIVLREIIRPAHAFFEKTPIGSTPVIAFLGPDGVGKSTVVQEINERLQANGIDSDTARLGVHSGSTRVLHSLRTVHNWWTSTSSQSVERSQGTATLGPRSSTGKAVPLVSDWIYRYLLANIRSPDVLIADRYLHELVVYADPGIFRSLFGVLEPDIGIILDDEIESVANRSEFSRDSVEEFQKRLKEIDWETFEVQDDSDSTVDQLMEFIVPRILARQSKTESTW